MKMKDKGDWIMKKFSIYFYNLWETCKKGDLIEFSASVKVNKAKIARLVICDGRKRFYSKWGSFVGWGRLNLKRRFKTDKIKVGVQSEQGTNILTDEFRAYNREVK